MRQGRFKMTGKRGVSMGIVILVLGIIVFFILIVGISKAHAFDKIKMLWPDFGTANEDVDASDKDIEYYSGDVFLVKERAADEILEYLVYASSKSVGGRKCLCGDYCENYSKWIVKYSNENGIPDALLLISVMMQESSCDKSASSESKEISFQDGASYGLMQISGRTWCGEYGLPENIDDCKNELLENPEKNIEVGSKILAREYDNYGEADDSEEYYKRIRAYCSVSSYLNRYLSYKGWERALRLYNGPGCNVKNADVDYVEGIEGRYSELKNAFSNEQ